MLVINQYFYKPMYNILEKPFFQDVAVNDPFLFASYIATILPWLDFVDDKTNSFYSLDSAEILREQFNVTNLKSASNEFKTSHDEMLKTIADAKKHFGNTITAAYMKSFSFGFNLYNEIGTAKQRRKFLNTFQSFFNDLLSDSENVTDIMKNFNEFCDIMKITVAERNVFLPCVLTMIEPAFQIFYRYLEISLGNKDALNLAASAMAEWDFSSEKSNKLSKFGICNFDHKTKQFEGISEWWLAVFSSKSISSFDDNFFVPYKTKSNYSGALASIEQKDADIIKKLINKKTEDHVGINILCYGASSLDKREAVYNTVSSISDVKVFELNRDVPKADMPGAVAYAQSVMSHNNILLLDDGDQALTAGKKKHSFWYELFSDNIKQENTEELSSDELLLTTNKGITFWLTSSASKIDNEALGRFIIHTEIKPASRQQRKDAIVSLTHEMNLSPEVKQKIANYVEIGIEQLKTAQKLTEITETGEDQFIMSIEASQKAMGRDSSEEVRETVTKYDLGLLNIHGKYQPERVIEALKKKNQGTLCFYGIPGTGKTQLAEYIALQLNKPLLVKRASDILDKWLGESEKNIKNMFEEAKNEDAVLLLDEADSFLRDRKLAKNSWEISTVNELLTRMEKYTGVFICATNLFENLDTAAIRRFTFKFEFKQLTEPQRVRMFHNETGVELTEEHKLFVDLMTIKNLTPGDFATVKRQASLFDEKLSIEDWIQQLALESKMKLME